MATKRKYNFDKSTEYNKSVGTNIHDTPVRNKKHTLDSDEEDSDDHEEKDLCASDVEGEEEGVSKIQDDIKIIPFNMREELEEGYFDKEGHYHYNNSSDIKDNWLDNIDCIKVGNVYSDNTEAKDINSAKPVDIYSESLLFTQLLSFMIEGETVAGSLRRLAKNRGKISSIERLKLKRNGIKYDNGDEITKLTELANKILIKTGNMDIYQATYESIKAKVQCAPSTSEGAAFLDSSFDMYSDDFTDKKTLHEKKVVEKDLKMESKELFWEFKWKATDTSLQGPFSTKQMLKWSKNGYFKTGVYVRKVGEFTNFYASSRIDFDLYL